MGRRRIGTRAYYGLPKRSYMSMAGRYSTGACEYPSSWPNSFRDMVDSPRHRRASFRHSTDITGDDSCSSHRSIWTQTYVDKHRIGTKTYHGLPKRSYVLTACRYSTGACEYPSSWPSSFRDEVNSLRHHRASFRHSTGTMLDSSFSS